MKDKTLFDKAVSNYQVACLIINNVEDEELINQAAYHLQQTVELSIKYLLEMNGIEYNKTHDIYQLIVLAKDNKVNLHLTEYIEDIADTLTIWEASTRYVLGYKIELKKINKALKEIDKYLKKIVKEERELVVI